MPAVEGDRNLDELILTRCVADYEEQTSHEGPTFAGADVGRVINVWVGRNNPDTGTRDWLAIFHLAGNGMDDVAQLGQIMHRFNVRVMVVDAMPETRAVKEFAARFPGRVKIAFYQDTVAAAKHRGETFRDTKGSHVLNIERTSALDAAAERFIMAQDRLPKMTPDKQREVFSQLCNMARVTEEDETTGEQKVVYQKVGPDHDRHCHSYATQAAGMVPNARAYMSISLHPEPATVVVEEGGVKKTVRQRSMDSIHADLNRNWLARHGGHGQARGLPIPGGQQVRRYSEREKPPRRG